MTKPNDKETKPLEELLKKAYGEQKPVAANGQWSARVMRTIRMHQPFKTASASESFGWFVWRLAPISAGLLVLLIACTFYFSFVPEYEIARFFVTNPIEFTLIESLGI